MSLRKIVPSVILLLCLQTPSPCQDAKADAAGEKSPLRYRLIVVNPEVCPKESLKLELELQNTSAHKVFIDPHGLVHNVTIVREGFATSPTGDRMGEPKPDEFVALAPGESYRQTLSYPLPKAVSSAVGKVHSIQVTYGQFSGPSPKSSDLFKGAVPSNKVLFEVTYCETR